MVKIMNEKIIAFGAILCIGLIVFVSYYFAEKTWSLGDDKSDYKIICLGDHEYWRANFMNKGLLGIKLDDSGKPIICEEK